VVTRVKVSSKNQIAVPSSVRKALHIQSGDHLRVEIHDNTIVLIPETKRPSERLRGLYSEIWNDIDPQEYVRRERDAWQD
jgi:AbrB family looped-hinge helix DNA binding protein